MIYRYTLYLCWLIAAIGTLGSLAFSAILHYEPCYMCWYERICLYPLAIQLGIAAYYGDGRMMLYALPLALIGLLISLYHVSIQEIPGWSPIELCGGGPPCAAKEFTLFGFFSIPMMSALAFLFISILLLVSVFHERKIQG